MTAVMAGLAFVSIVANSDAAFADHSPGWGWPITPWSYKDEVICGAQGSFHFASPGKDDIWLYGRALRAAGVCNGAARPGPGPLRISMAAYGINNGYTFNCFPSYVEVDHNSADAWAERNVAQTCPVRSGLKIQFFASFGGVIWDRDFGQSWPVIQEWYP